MAHAEDNPGDRASGTYWEQRFAVMAAGLGIRCRRDEDKNWPYWDFLLTYPDGHQEHHEIKNKRPTSRREYGLEEHRLQGMLERSSLALPIFYTIHDWELAGASTSREPMLNRMGDWRTVAIDALGDLDRFDPRGKTYYGGKLAYLPMWFWYAHKWSPLGRHWGLEIEPEKPAAVRPASPQLTLELA